MKLPNGLDFLHMMCPGSPVPETADGISELHLGPF